MPYPMSVDQLPAVEPRWGRHGTHSRIPRELQGESRDRIENGDGAARHESVAQHWE
jgi:hypothetical protein